MLEEEVNSGKNFAMLRQITSAMLLATWYKKALKESLLGKFYADKAKVKGIDQDPTNNEVIYQKYLAAFKKGVYNYIKEDFAPSTRQSIPRKYFAGGFHPGYEDAAQITHMDPAQLAKAIVQNGDNDADLATVALDEARDKDRAEVLHVGVPRWHQELGIPQDLQSTLKQVAAWERRPTRYYAGRHGLIVLPKPVLVNIAGKQYTIRSIKAKGIGDTSDPRHPTPPKAEAFKPSSAFLTDVINHKIRPRLPSEHPKGGEFIDSVIHEDNVTWQAINSGADVTIPLGYIDYPGIIFKGKKLGVLFLGLPSADDKRINDLFSSRYLFSDFFKRVMRRKKRAAWSDQDAFKFLMGVFEKQGRTLTEFHQRSSLVGFQTNTGNFGFTENGEVYVQDLVHARSKAALTAEDAFYLQLLDVSTALLGIHEMMSTTWLGRRMVKQGKDPYRQFLEGYFGKAIVDRSLDINKLLREINGNAFENDSGRNGPNQQYGRFLRQRMSLELMSLRNLWRPLLQEWQGNPPHIFAQSVSKQLKGYLEAYGEDYTTELFGGTQEMAGAFLRDMHGLPQWPLGGAIRLRNREAIQRLRNLSAIGKQRMPVIFRSKNYMLTSDQYSISDILNELRRRPEKLAVYEDENDGDITIYDTRWRASMKDKFAPNKTMDRLDRLAQLKREIDYLMKRISADFVKSKLYTATVVRPKGEEDRWVISVWPVPKIDINNMAKAELQEIVGPEAAEQIISERDRNGFYSSLQEIGARLAEFPNTIEKIHRNLSVVLAARFTIEPYILKDSLVQMHVASAFKLGDSENLPYKKLQEVVRIGAREAGINLAEPAFVGQGKGIEAEAATDAAVLAGQDFEEDTVIDLRDKEKLLHELHLVTGRFFIFAGGQFGTTYKERLDRMNEVRLEILDSRQKQVAVLSYLMFGEALSEESLIERLEKTPQEDPQLFHMVLAASFVFQSIEQAVSFNKSRTGGTFTFGEMNSPGSSHFELEGTGFLKRALWLGLNQIFSFDFPVEAPAAQVPQPTLSGEAGKVLAFRRKSPAPAVERRTQGIHKPDSNSSRNFRELMQYYEGYAFRALKESGDTYKTSQFNARDQYIMDQVSLRAQGQAAKSLSVLRGRDVPWSTATGEEIIALMIQNNAPLTDLAMVTLRGDKNGVKDNQAMMSRRDFLKRSVVGAVVAGVSALRAQAATTREVWDPDLLFTEADNKAIVQDLMSRGFSQQDSEIIIEEQRHLVGLYGQGFSKELISYMHRLTKILESSNSSFLGWGNWTAIQIRTSSYLGSEELFRHWVVHETAHLFFPPTEEIDPHSAVYAMGLLRLFELHAENMIFDNMTLYQKVDNFGNHHMYVGYNLAKEAYELEKRVKGEGWKYLGEIAQNRKELVSRQAFWMAKFWGTPILGLAAAYAGLYIRDKRKKKKLREANAKYEAMFREDPAMQVNNMDPVGGIDLNSANLNMQIKRDGKGVPLPLTQQDMAQLSNIQGFEPTIIEIKPAAMALPILVEMQHKLKQ